MCPDAPDLPALLLGKLHSALTSAEVAVCPADDGRLVALATRLPAPEWLRETAATLDDDDAVRRLRAQAPRRALHVGPRLAPDRRRRRTRADSTPGWKAGTRRERCSVV